MQPQANLTRRIRTAAVFTCALLASLAFAASQQAAASSAATPIISAGAGHSCGVTTTGEGFCWGNNPDGRTDVPTGKTWASIAAGDNHSCGVTTIGEGLCWGFSGNLRNDVPTGKTWASITPGQAYSCGVTTIGEGLCWGDNSHGETDVPTGKTWASITANGGTSCGVTNIGEGFCWGDYGWGGVNVPAGKTWASITAGAITTCGVTTIGEGLCWGNNDSAQTDVPTGKVWASITPGYAHSCGVTTSGEGICWGRNDRGQTNVPTGKTWASISAGVEHTCGVTTRGEGLCWGYDGSVAGYNYYDYYYAPVPADGRLVVPAGKFDADTTAPAAPVLSGAPSGLSNLRTASISFTGEVGATFTCSLDDAAFTDCGGSPASLSALTDGEHTFRVKAVDGAGNTSEEAASATWTIDATAPTAPSLSGVPGEGTKATSLSIGIQGEGNATFLCSVDGGGYSFCSSPLRLRRLAPGGHVVLVKQTDEAGNTSPEATASWTVLATNAPNLLTKVGLKFNFQTRVTTLSLNASADTEGGPNSIKWIEYYSHPRRPAANARQNPGKIRQYATTVVLPAKEVAFWVRVKDTRGKWSGWYSTKH